MANMFDYLNWRGDLPFACAPLNPVDALIFSTLCYTQFGTQVTDDPIRPVFLSAAVEAFFAQPDHEARVRDKRDLKLLLAAAQSPRFGNVGLCFHRDEFFPEEETQFAAMTFLLDDGTAFLAYRGTDTTLVGWKEDFNMSFQDTVPSQRKAQAYVQEFSSVFPRMMYLGGHSKGGNLAVFAGAKCGIDIQNRILAVYNLDGPGFGQYLMGDPGYIAMVPRIQTYIPQSSIIGMLLEHEEPYTVIKSSQISIMQHDPYSWEIMAGHFIDAGEMSADTRFLDQTIKHWLAGMSTQERNEFVDTVFELLSAGGAEKTHHLIRPQNIRAFFKALSADDNVRRLLAGELASLIQSAKSTQQKLELQLTEK